MNCRKCQWNWLKFSCNQAETENGISPTSHNNSYFEFQRVWSFRKDFPISRDLVAIVCRPTTTLNSLSSRSTNPLVVTHHVALCKARRSRFPVVLPPPLHIAAGCVRGWECNSLTCEKFTFAQNSSTILHELFDTLLPPTTSEPSRESIGKVRKKVNCERNKICQIGNLFRRWVTSEARGGDPQPTATVNGAAKNIRRLCQCSHNNAIQTQN